VTLWGTHQPWLIAWSLVDLRKARTIFEAELVAIDRDKRDVGSWTMAFFQMVELLTAPPDRREAALERRSAGGYWRPDGEF
jgi:hypothetical protein